MPEDDLKLKNWARVSTESVMCLFELMRFITETADAGERFRVVVEYDPEACKTIVSIWTKADGCTQWECPVLPRLAYPKAKEQ